MVLWGLVRWILIGRRDGLRARLRRVLSIFTWLDEDRDDGARDDGQVGASDDGIPKVQAPPGFQAVLHRDALQAGEIIEVIVGGDAVALANVGGDYFAVSNVCAHAGGPIGDGALDGHTVTCPYHGWSYDVRTGACFVNQEVSLDTFEVQVVEDAICIRAAQ